MRAFTITHADIATCPYRILSVEHWREDGTCKCTTTTEPKDHAVTTLAFIIETTQRQYVVEDGAGPLADYDEDDPTTGAAAIWTSIDGREPIWTNAGVVYFNPRHVILVREEPSRGTA